MPLKALFLVLSGVCSSLRACRLEFVRVSFPVGIQTTFQRVDGGCHLILRVQENVF